MSLTLDEWIHAHRRDDRDLHALDEWIDEHCFPWDAISLPRLLDALVDRKAPALLMVIARRAHGAWLSSR